MSEQLQDGDRKIVKESENRYNIYRYDGKKKKWKHKHVADGEGATNYVDGNLQPRGTDSDGNPILRPKK